MPNRQRPDMIEILMVEDNPGDVVLTQEALKDGKVKNRLNIAKDGVEAMAFLHKEGQYANAPLPDLILLDINLPRKNGHEVLKEIKSDSSLSHIPVVMLTSSDAERDIVKAYSERANCYIQKPVDLERFLEVVKSIDAFWLSIVKLPPKET